MKYIKLLILSLYNYRGFIFSSVKREFQSKYQNSVLGFFWNILQPLSMIIVYAVVFSELMKSRIPGIDNSFGYTVYLCSGVIVWGLFSEILLRSINIFVDNSNLIKKINFPKLCLPLTIIINALVNFSIIFLIFIILLIYSGLFHGWSIFYLLPVIILLIMFAISIGLFFGIMNVFFRDVSQFFQIVIQFWFWLTPIIYMKSIVPERFIAIINYNPMTKIIVACQSIILEGRSPDISTFYSVILFTLLFSILTIIMYRKHSGEMVDEL